MPFHGRFSSYTARAWQRRHLASENGHSHVRVLACPGVFGAASQPHPNPSVQVTERRLAAVLEVLKPAPQRRREVVDDLRQALPGCPLCLCSDRVFDLLHALGSWEACAAREPIAQEIKGIFRRIHNLGLLRMQFQAGFHRPFLHQSQGASGVLGTAIHDHEIVGVTHHLESPLCHQVVQGVEVDIIEQRADAAALR
jgi:hypothetical protein